MSLPTEAEIHAGAKELGLADENGNYRQRDRARIAAAVQAAKAEADKADDPAAGNTAEQLARFDLELFERNIDRESRGRILAVAAAHLLEIGGLNLRPREEETTP